MWLRQTNKSTRANEQAIHTVNSMNKMYIQTVLSCLVVIGTNFPAIISQPLPLIQPVTVVTHEIGTSPVCPVPNDVIAETLNTTAELLQQASAFLSLPTSCAEAAEQDDFTPGLYWIRTANSTAQVYCGAEGLTRIAFLDMSDPAEVCPAPWTEIIVTGSVRSCIRNFTGSGCQSVFYSTYGMEYNKVCGRIIGYQYGNVGAFQRYYLDNTLTIDDVYFDGLVLTIGPPGFRHHVWTWAASLSQIYNAASDNCVCTNVGSPSPAISPSWVGNDYFCETGTSGLWGGQFYADDPLWDGDGCAPGSSCCTFPGGFIQPNLNNIPPNFCKELPFTTTEDLEIRFCRAAGGSNFFGTPVELMEFSVQLV